MASLTMPRRRAEIIAFTRNAAHELLPLNIQVNAVLPVARSRMTDALAEFHTRFSGEQIAAHLSNLAPPDVLLPVFLFLASSDSDYITGQIIGADGGFLALRGCLLSPQALVCVWSPCRESQAKACGHYAYRESFAETKRDRGLYTSIQLAKIPGTHIASSGFVGGTMNTIRNTTERTPCGRSLQELEIPMVNSMVSCLGSEHKKLDEQTLPLALAATRLARDKDPIAGQAALEAWEQVQGYLFSHLQIEDALVLTWGLDHGAISTTLLDTLSLERQEMRGLMEGMPAPSGQDRQPKAIRERQALAQRLLALVRLLDQHIARYDSEVLPSIRRALFK